VWQDLAHSLVGAASASGFDGNGSWLRLLGSTSERTIGVGTKLPSGDTLLGAAPLPIAGTRPQPLPPKLTPPLRADQECRGQTPPDLKAETGPAPPDQSPVSLEKAPSAAGVERLLRRAARSAGR
jgi:hypothetical protein